MFIWLSGYLETNGFLQSLCLFDYQDYIQTLKQNILQPNLHMNGHLIVIYSVCVFFALKSMKCVVSERVIVVECQVGKFTAIIWPDQVSFWWMDFIVFTHWKNSQSIDRHVALIENLIPSLSQPGTTKQSPVESGGLILVYMYIKWCIPVVLVGGFFYIFLIISNKINTK